MASSSSSSQRKPGKDMLPLIPCPSCKDKVLSFLCGPNGSRPGDRFYKCIHKDSGKCRFYEWQEGYAKLLVLLLCTRLALFLVPHHVGSPLDIYRQLLCPASAIHPLPRVATSCCSKFEFQKLRPGTLTETAQHRQYLDTTLQWVTVTLADCPPHNFLYTN